MTVSSDRFSYNNITQILNDPKGNHEKNYKTQFNFKKRGLNSANWCCVGECNAAFHGVNPLIRNGPSTKDLRSIFVQNQGNMTSFSRFDPWYFFQILK